MKDPGATIKCWCCSVGTWCVIITKKTGVEELSWLWPISELIFKCPDFAVHLPLFFTQTFHSFHWQMRLCPRAFSILRNLVAVVKKPTLNPQRRGVSGVAMRLVQFQQNGGGVRVGVEQSEGQGVVDLKAFDPSMPSTMRELLELGDKGLDCARR